MLAVAALAAVLTLASCSADTQASGSEGTLKVVATTTQLGDFAHQVGGDDIALTELLKAGASAHHFDPSPADLLALGEADVLIVNGAGLETFVDSAIDASGFDGTIITAADGIDLATAREITLEGADGSADAHADHDHAADEHTADEHADHDHAADDHAADEHAAAAEHDHDHGDLNPHIWTSPVFAQGMVDEIGRGLAAADPTHAADYTSRAADYSERLAELNTWTKAEFDRVPAADRVLVSGHDSLRYYLHDYGIQFAGSILPSFEDNAEPSAAQIDALVASIKDRGVKAIFVESSMSPKLAETVARESGAKVVSAESLYADSLAADGEAASYIGATVHNTRLILEAWGVTPDATPATLQ